MEKPPVIDAEFEVVQPQRYVARVSPKLVFVLNVVTACGLGCGAYYATPVQAVLAVGAAWLLWPISRWLLSSGPISEEAAERLRSQILYGQRR